MALAATTSRPGSTFTISQPLWPTSVRLCKRRRTCFGVGMAPPRNLSALDERWPHTLRAADSSSTDRADTVAARCVEIPPSSEGGGGAPERMMLLPAGPEVEGRNGRKWRLDSAEEE